MVEVLLVSTVVLWLVVIFQALVLLGLIRALTHRDSQTDQPADDRVVWQAPVAGVLTGQQAPRLPPIDATGRPVDLDRLTGHARVVLFVSPTCPRCTLVVDSLESVASLFDAASDAVVLVCAATTDRCADMVNRPGLDAPVVPDTDSALTAQWGVQTLPTAIGVGADGVIGDYRTLSQPNAEAMMRQIMAQMASVDTAGHQGGRPVKPTQ